jgi:hypothetical protein
VSRAWSGGIDARCGSLAAPARGDCELPFCSLRLSTKGRELRGCIHCCIRSKSIVEPMSWWTACPECASGWTIVGLSRMSFGTVWWTAGAVIIHVQFKSEGEAIAFAGAFSGQRV